MYQRISQLKALSIEMDLPESGINRQVFFKGRGVDIFGKSTRSSSWRLLVL
jgi:hypothetical protein